MGYIYMIENQINHKKYIGQTRRKLKARISSQLTSHTRDNKKLREDVKIYGAKSFTVSTIIVCDDYKLDYYEKWFILLYNTIKYGYNHDLGGIRGKHGEPKVCPICKTKFYIKRGKYCSKECRLKAIPRLRIIKKCCNCGKEYETHPCKKESSKYCSLKCKNEHQKITMQNNTHSKGKNQGSNNGRAKPCVCIETGQVFSTARLASDWLGCKNNDVASVCSGRQKSARGFHFAWLIRTEVTN